MVDLLISGPEGKIEAKYNHNNKDDSPIVLILHPDPSRALSDGPQSLYPNQFGELMDQIRVIAQAIGREIQSPAA